MEKKALTEKLEVAIKNNKTTPSTNLEKKKTFSSNYDQVAKAIRDSIEDHINAIINENSESRFKKLF